MKKISKYEMIYQDLKQKILKGSFPDGKLPSAAELTDIYGASLLTVNNAVKLLADDGIVLRGTGRSGTRINQPGLRRINIQERSSNSWGNFSHRRVTLKYITESSGACIPEQMSAVIREFEKKYPWIHVEQDFTDSIDFLQKSEHDIIQASHSVMLPLISHKRLLDLNPYFEKFGRCNRCLHDDCTIPLMVSMPFIFCSEDVKNIPQDWQEFIELNRLLKKDGKRSAMLLGFFSSLYFFIGDVCRELFNEDKTPSFIQLIEILREYYKWEMPWNNLAPDEILSAVRKNKLSMMVAYIGKTFIEMSNSMKVAPLPDKGVYLAETVRVGIRKDCQYPTEAWLFINFLRSERVQKILVEKAYGIPYHEKVFHSDFREKFPNLYDNAAPVFKKILETNISERARDMIYHVVYPMLEECFNNNISAEKCVELLRDAINELMILDAIENKY